MKYKCNRCEFESNSREEIEKHCVVEHKDPAPTFMDDDHFNSVFQLQVNIDRFYDSPPVNY